MSTIILAVIMNFFMTFAPGAVTGVSTAATEPPREPVTGIFFSLGYVQVDPEDRECYLDSLATINRETGLYVLNINEQGFFRLTKAGVLDLELHENECNGSWYGHINSDGHGCEYLIGGVPGMETRRSWCIDPETGYLPPLGYVIFAWDYEDNGRDLFRIHATGDCEPGREDNATNLRIFLQNQGTGQQQLLTTIEYLEYTVPSVLLIADIDGDGLPDVILDETWNYELSKPVIYLSSLAREGEMVGRVAEYMLWTDC